MDEAVSQLVAAEHVSPTPTPVAERALVHAGQGYLGTVTDDWASHDAETTARELVDQMSGLREARQP